MRVILEVLRQILGAADKILARLETIQKVSDFTGSPAGAEKMDSICMLLIVIGESLKKLDKITGGEIFLKHLEINWKKTKGMWDILSHNYGDVRAETVFFTCKNKIKPLRDAIDIMMWEV
jgi:uncharacterized protein with HEPN domain